MRHWLSSDLWDRNTRVEIFVSGQIGIEEIDLITEMLSIQRGILVSCASRLSTKGK